MRFWAGPQSSWSQALPTLSMEILDSKSSHQTMSLCPQRGGGGQGDLILQGSHLLLHSQKWQDLGHLTQRKLAPGLPPCRGTWDTEVGTCLSWGARCI